MTTVRAAAVQRVVLALAIVTLAGLPARAQQGLEILTDSDGSRSVLNQHQESGDGGTTATEPLGVNAGQSWDPPVASNPSTCVVGSGLGTVHNLHECDPSPRTACGTGGVNDPPGLIQCLEEHKTACWALRTDAIVLWRNAPPPRAIFSTIDPSTGGLGPTALDADEMNSDVLAAPRLSLFRTDCEGRTLEATYLYAGYFYSDRALPFSRNGYVTSPPGIYGNEWGVEGTQLNSATTKLLGQLQSMEFNSRHCFWQDSCQFLYGFRWLQWNESLQMQDFFSAPPPPAPITDQGIDFYDTQCFNNLWGGQLGIDSVLLGAAEMFRVEGLVKAGAYYNHAGQYSSYRYATSSGGSFSSAARADGPATCSFVGEIGLTSVIPISSRWDLRCGYFGLCLTGLAQPTNQLSDQNITQIGPASGALNTTGTLFLQGVSLGLEGRW